MQAFEDLIRRGGETALRELERFFMGEDKVHQTLHRIAAKLDELGIPRDEQHKYVVPLDLAPKSDLAGDGILPLGTDVEAFNEGYRAGYEAGYLAALEEHGLEPKKPGE